MQFLIEHLLNQYLSGGGGGGGGEWGQIEINYENVTIILQL